MNLLVVLILGWLVVGDAAADINKAIDIGLEEFYRLHKNFSVPFDPVFPSVVKEEHEEGSAAGLCRDKEEELGRLGCCAPSDAIYLENVIVKNGKFVVHLGHNHSHPAKSYSLPGVKSVHMQRPVTFSMQVDQKHGLLSQRHCTSFFNGTLHVFGRSTTHNVYHAMGDNFAPLASQILMDAFMNPAFLHLPRMGLVGFPGHSESDHTVPHLRLVDDLMTAGFTKADHLEGMCFRRVAWGHGPHVLYLDSLVVLRRIMADFARSYVMNNYKISPPKEFVSITGGGGGGAGAATVDKAPGDSLVVDGRPLRVVLYSRGTSGKGRSMQGEDLIIKALTLHGAEAAICCDFSRSTLEEQLAYAVHADVVMGMHGAALAHGLFMNHGGIILELKTLYGFTSGLFQVIADSRSGLLAQVDARSYWIKGGHRSIDAPLVERTMHILREALTLKSSGSFLGKKVCTKESNKDLVDCVVGAIDIAHSPALMHPLGPPLKSYMDVCQSTVLYDFRKVNFDSPQDDLHCAKCSNFRR